MKNVVILGSTGSIGVNSLDIISTLPEKFRVMALCAGNNLAKLAEQVEKFKPAMVSIADKARVKELRSLLDRKTKIVAGVEGAIECASSPEADIVISAMVGAAGLAPTLAAIKAGKTLALANKETLVTAGELVMKEARKRKVRVIPVDSEHSAIFQALRGEKMKTVRKLILTASAGPFLRTPISELKSVTVEQALKHPNWSMGPKITIDSATMMNKGLEVIEARWLFNLPPEKIEALVHPQSVIHSMVEFYDSSVIAQLGLPDMRAPISYALGYPDRLEVPLPSLDLAVIGRLTFEPPDHQRFPALKLAYDALAAGGSAPAVLNAANEVAVDAFLKRKIGFTDISRIVGETLDVTEITPARTLAEILNADKQARAAAGKIIEKIR